MTASGFYHCSVKPVGRATGRSAVAASAYRSGERLHDDRTGLTHDYTAKGGIVASFIVAPEGAPEWVHTRAALWNNVEAATKAKNGRLATELEVALPHELSDDQRRELVAGFARDLADRYKVAVDVAIHKPGRGGDHRNDHAHIMVTHREIGAEGFGEICNRRGIERKVKGEVKRVEIGGFTTSEDTTALRSAWAEATNRAYEQAGLSVRVDHRSHADRGIDAEPTKHLGPSAMGMERRGETTSRGDENRAVAARNAQRTAVEAERLSVASAIADLVAERQARADAKELRAAVRTASADRILDALTEKRATFTRAELTGLLRRGGVEDKAEAASMTTELLAHPDVIGLRETADSAVTRYTTRAVLADERKVLDDARALVGGGNRGLSDRQRAAAMRDHKHLDEEQRAAFEAVTGRRGLSIIAGEAGTGKSTTLAAVRDAYEKAGYRVQGLAWTNSVVQDMRADGFRDTSTIKSALMRLEKGTERWDAKTVLVVDEAAMLSSHYLGRVLEKARAGGADVILSGDDRQFPSIERGGVFSALKAEHGAAELHTVWRVQDAAQQQAFNHMHAGRFGAALDIFDQAGAIRWTETQDEARLALVGQWAADTKADPNKQRFVFAYSNADVGALNSDLRAVRRERGELGRDHYLQTKDGPAAFAAGDRVQFTGSAYSREAKASGLVTGGMGVIRGIDGPRVTVELDGRGTKKGRLVSFTVGDNERAGQFNAIRHGYAGTIYKGQGRTLDQSYLYHSQNWRASSAYVALSRHRDSTALFVAREVTRGAEPWMMQQGGFVALDERQKASADQSYQAWAEANPGPGARFGVAEYVTYVQGKQTERGRSAFDMAQLARQIGRTEETRAASQFVIDGAPATGKTEKGTTGSGIPKLAGAVRMEALVQIAREAKRRAGQLGDLLPRTLGRKASPLGKYDALKREQADTAAKRAASVTPPPALDDFVSEATRRKVAQSQRERDAARNKSRGLDYEP